MVRDGLSVALGLQREGPVQLANLWTDWMPLIALGETILIAALVATVAYRRSEIRRERGMGQ